MIPIPKNLRIQLSTITSGLCLLTLLFSCRPNTPATHTKLKVAPPVAVAPNKGIDEEKAVNLIMQLEEVKHKNAEVEELSKGKKRLSTYVETLPTVSEPYYWVKVAEHNGDSYVTYYIFAVHQKTGTIRYYDAMQDSLLSVEDWRRQEADHTNE